MAVTVLGAGTSDQPMSRRRRAILRPPQLGLVWRTASTASSNSDAVRVGLVCGRRERG